MTSRFLAKVLYTAQLANGAFERKIEQLVFEASTYTDCEAAVYKYMESVTRAEFTIMKIDRFQVSTFHTVAIDKEAPFFLVKIEWISVEDFEVKEKILIQCETIDSARLVVEDLVKNNLSVNYFIIKSIVETKITDYIYAEADQD